MATSTIINATTFPLSATLKQSNYSYNITNVPAFTTETALMGEDLDYYTTIAEPIDHWINSTLGKGDNETLFGELAKTIAKRKANEVVPIEAAIGVILAICANFINGFAIIVKKQSLNQLESVGATRASEGGFGYLVTSRWWMGFGLMAFGEMLNFLAYIFAPAILVTSLAVVSILTTTILTPIILKVKLDLLGRLGCVLAVLGCLVVTLCGPKENEVVSLDQLDDLVMSTRFIVYSIFVIVTTSTLVYISPKYGRKYIIVYVLIITLCASLAIMFAKGVGIGLKVTIADGENAFTRWSFYFCFFALLVCLGIEIVYSQIALDIFNPSILTSVMYVFFVSLVVLTSTVLFSQNSVALGWKDIILTLAGFLVNIIALIILNFDKDPSLSAGKGETTAEEIPSFSPRPLEGTDSIVKPSVNQLYEIKHDNRSEGYSASVCHSPKSTPLKISAISSCTLPNISAAMFRETAESNSCLSLISETNSSKNSTDTNSQGSSVGVNNFRAIDSESGSHRSSFSNRSIESNDSSGGGKVMQDNIHGRRHIINIPIDTTSLIIETSEKKQSTDADHGEQSNYSIETPLQNLESPVSDKQKSDNERYTEIDEKETGNTNC